MENNNMNNDLKLMREQMQMLRNKLDKQEIINDKMLRQSVKKGMSWIKNFVYLEFLLIPFMAVVWYGIKEMFDLSWWNYGFLLIMCTIDVVLDYYVNVASLKIEKDGESSLTESMRKLIKMKHIRAKQFYIMITLCAAWFVWTGIEMWQFAGSISGGSSIIQAPSYGGMTWYFSTNAMIIGVPVCFLIAICIFRKMQRTNDELIQQIEEFTEKS